MAAIVAGRFESYAEAEHTVTALLQRGFTAEQIASFYVTPPGQHAIFAVGGDAYSDEGSWEAGKGAAKGITVGALAGAVVGGVIGAASPIGAGAAVAIAAAGAGAGAYTGSLVSGLKSMRPGNERAATPERPVSRKAGPLVAVRVHSREQRDEARGVLRDQSALDIEQAEGTLVDGDWIDFDPRLPPSLIDGLKAAEGSASTISRRYSTGR